MTTVGSRTSLETIDIDSESFAYVPGKKNLELAQSTMLGSQKALAYLAKNQIAGNNLGDKQQSGLLSTTAKFSPNLRKGYLKEEMERVPNWRKMPSKPFKMFLKSQHLGDDDPSFIPKTSGKELVQSLAKSPIELRDGRTLNSYNDRPRPLIIQTLSIDTNQETASKIIEDRWFQQKSRVMVSGYFAKNGSKRKTTESQLLDSLEPTANTQDEKLTRKQPTSSTSLLYDRNPHKRSTTEPIQDSSWSKLNVLDSGFANLCFTEMNRNKKAPENNKWENRPFIEGLSREMWSKRMVSSEAISRIASNLNRPGNLKSRNPKRVCSFARYSGFDSKPETNQNGVQMKRISAEKNTFLVDQKSGGFRDHSGKWTQLFKTFVNNTHSNHKFDTAGNKVSPIFSHQSTVAQLSVSRASISRTQSPETRSSKWQQIKLLDCSTPTEMASLESPSKKTYLETSNDDRKLYHRTFGEFLGQKSFKKYSNLQSNTINEPSNPLRKFEGLER